MSSCDLKDECRMRHNGVLLKNDSAKDRLMNRSTLLCAVLLSFSGLIFSQEAKPGHLRSEAALSLREGWSLQSSGKVDEKGETLSTPAFQPKDWYTVTVPTTVVAALVEHKVYPDPFFGTNLRSFPGSPTPSAQTFPTSRCSRTVPSSCPGGIARNLSCPPASKGRASG